MNRSFKSKFNRKTGLWQAVSENTSNTGKTGSAVALPMLAVMLGLAGVTPNAQALCVTVGSTVSCTGITVGLVSSTSNLTVNVQNGAQIYPGVVDSNNAVSLTGTGVTVNNAGRLDPSLLPGLVSPASGINISNPAGSTVTVNNLSTGQIMGASTLQGANLLGLSGVGMVVQNGAGGTTTINNTGRIGGTALPGAAVLEEDIAVMALRGGARNVVTNNASGIITGRIALQASTLGNTFTNAGTITGSVNLGAGSGSNTFNAVTGSSFSGGAGVGTDLGVLGGLGIAFAPTGKVNGGALNNGNTLNLMNAIGGGSGTNGTGTIDGNSYDNFNNLVVSSGTWSLTNQLFKAGTVNATVQLNGGVLNVDSSVLTNAAVTANGGGLGASVADANISNAIALGSNGLVVAGANNLTLSGVLSGTGQLVKRGSGTLTLSGNNLYTGGTTFEGGTVEVGSSTALGAGEIFFNGGNLRSSENVVVSSNVQIDNATTLSAASGKTLTLNGDVILLSPVLLTFGSATDNGTVRFEVNNLLISSTSSIHIAGGTLTGSRISDLTEFLSSTSVVSGATLDFEGRFAVVKNLQGAGLVKNDGSTTDIQAGAFSGKFTGTGNLNMNGSGTLTLTGNNDYTGTTTVTAGNLVVGNGGTSGNLGTGSIVNNATLSFNRSDDFALANALSGTGTLKKLGTGTLNYTGDGSVYSGVTSVVDGGLAVNGTLNGLINVDSGASLSGTGTTGSVSVASGGVLAPGNSIGTLNVNGNVNLDPGASYRVEADAAGASDKVIVTGNASLNGNVVALPQTGGTYKANTKYTILTANSITGNFNSSVSSSLAFLDASVTQDTNNVYLNLRRNDIAYAAVAQTPNQRGVANAIERVAATDNASTEMTTVVNTINNLSAGQARSAFESMSGAGLAGLQRVGMGFTGNFATQLNGRLQSAGMGRTAQSINGMQLAANDRLGDLMPAFAQNTMSDVPSSSKFSLGGGVPVDDGKRGFWLRGFGFDQDTDGDGNAAGSRVKGVGLSAGFDKRLQNNLVVGAAFSHSTSDVRASFAETGKSRGNALAAYASYASGPWTFNGNLILSHHENSMNRNVTVGALTSTARANFDSKAISAYGEASYDLPQTTWTLQPLAGLSVTHNRSDGFIETGAGALNIQADAQSITSTKTLFGARALFEFDGIHVQPRAVWAHELGDVNKGMTAQLQGSPAATFITYGVDLPRDSFIAGLTVAGRTAGGLSLFADVQSEFSSKQTGLALLVGVRKSW